MSQQVVRTLCLRSSDAERPEEGAFRWTIHSDVKASKIVLSSIELPMSQHSIEAGGVGYTWRSACASDRRTLTLTVRADAERRGRRIVLPMQLNPISAGGSVVPCATRTG